MSSYVGERENNGLLLLSSCNNLATEGARRWPPQQRRALIRRRLSLQPFFSRSSWACTHGSWASRRVQRSGRGSDKALPGDCQTVLEEIRRATSRFGLPEAARVVSCYEAGRDGFWLHRFFVSQGVENAVVDSASLEVNRRYRRAKTDRLDVHKLLTMLLRHAAGEKKVWSVVRVPSVVDEDRRSCTGNS
jgi:hypothetical protein